MKQTQPTNPQLEKMAVTMEQVCKHCRNAWTLEKTSFMVTFEKYSYPLCNVMELWNLVFAFGLIDVVDSADLHYICISDKVNVSWTVEQWKQYFKELGF